MQDYTRDQVVEMLSSGHETLGFGWRSSRACKRPTVWSYSFRLLIEYLQVEYVVSMKNATRVHHRCQSVKRDSRSTNILRL